MTQQETQPVDLFDPVLIGTLKVRNRVILPALILNYPFQGYEPGSEWTRFYRRRAEGGVGMIIVGACHVTAEGRQDAHQLGADRDEWLPALENIAHAIKEKGAVPALQLNHAGRYSRKEITGLDPVAPSPIGSAYTGQVPRELEPGEVESVIEAFADAAFRAQKAGFEAIELLGATGYLISQFLSPVTNHRTDRFGGDFEGRLTFVRELIRSIKTKAGNDYPIIFRLSSKDSVPGGLDETDQKNLAVKLAEWGVHLINVTAGWHDAPVHQIGPSVSHGHFIPYAAAIKKKVNIPVSCAVRITAPDLARRVIQEEQLDMVTMARALIADPDWPHKAEAGNDERVRQCICCCHCFDRAFARSRIECSINAQLNQNRILPAEKPKRILVVGGGPAGMEAARVLALRGHSVVLQEKEEVLGGKIEIAAIPPHKQEFMKLTQYFSSELNRLHVDIRTGNEFKDMQGRYDGIILATGAREKELKIQGMEQIPCYLSSQILSGDKEPIDPVVILGAGLVGGETADYLCERGYKVALVELLKKPLPDMGATLRWVLMSRLKEAGAVFYTSSSVVEIEQNRVLVHTPEGNLEVPAGCLVFAIGFESTDDLVEKIKQTKVPYCVIGDKHEPIRIKDAIHEGFWAATQWVDEAIE